MNRDRFYSTSEAVSEAFFRIWEYEGRSTRSAFWKFQFAQFILFLLLSYIYGPLWAIIEHSSGLDSSALESLSIAIFILCIIPLAIINIPLICRRLADSGKSPLFALLLLIPHIGIIIIGVMCCFDSEKGSNNWGESLKYPDEK